MKTFFTAYERVLNRLNWVVSWLVVAIGLSLTVIISCEVVSRYLFNSSITMVEELSRLLLIWLGYLGAYLALHEGGHVGFDLVRARLGRSVLGVWLLVVNGMVMGCFFIAMLWASVVMMPMLRSQMSATLGLPMLVPYLAITVSSASMIFRLIYSLACLMFGREERLRTMVELLPGDSGVRV